MEKRLRVLVTWWIPGGLLLLSIAALGSMARQDDIYWQFLQTHNADRMSIKGARLHNLSYDDTLTQHAQYEAEAFAGAPRYCNASGLYNNHFRNLHVTSVGASVMEIVRSWVGESKYYNYSTNSCAPGKTCDHYLRVVWNTTKFMGCGLARCPDGGSFTVCYYNPVGVFFRDKPY
ncbi:hypothetical protein MPTK2_7g06810 [Marchantia polymorpha subsp. ruderalis]